MKPYQQIPIAECGEPLVPIPLEQFTVELPHPYEKLGASYGERSPYHLRKSVVDALVKAQYLLKKRYPGWRIKIFDAYRPVGVQQFMVNYTFDSAIEAQGLYPELLSPQQRQRIWEQVYQIWAIPTLDPHTPPPHSTGAAIDVTLVDDKGRTLNMGSEIDELSERVHPNYYVNSTKISEIQYHRQRQLLYQVMIAAGFRRHPGEWWHFSLGDQMWAWLYNQEYRGVQEAARYGRADLLL